MEPTELTNVVAVGGDTRAIATEAPSIRRQFDAIDKSLAELAEWIGGAGDRTDRLAARIAPVLGPDLPMPGGVPAREDATTSAGQSPLAEELERRAAEIAEKARAVAYLASRLDVLADRVEL